MLTIVSTHPIQYQVPIWRELARRGRVPIEVIYLCDHGHRNSFDPQFGRAFTWDVDLLDGYPSRFVHPGKSPAGFASLHVSGAMLRDLARTKPKAVWIQGWQVAGYWEAAAAARLLGAELWLRAETNARSGQAGVLRPVRNAALRALFALTSNCLYIGAANRAFYLERGVDEGRLARAPYGVDNALFRAAATRSRLQRDDIRRAWNIPADAFCFLFVGKFIDKKRPGDIVAAMRRLGDTRRIHMLWVGEGELLGDIRTQATRCSQALAGVGSSFVGFLNQSEIVNAYGAADCLILPSEADETWGVVVNEALASGLPAIISDACGCAADLVVPGFEDFVYPVGDVDALARSMRSALARLPTDAELANKIAGYDMRKTVDAAEALYFDSFT